MAYVSLLHHGSKPHRDRTLLYDKKKFLIFICTEHQKKCWTLCFPNHHIYSANIFNLIQ